MSAAAPLLASATAGPELIARPMARLQRCGGTTCPPGTCGHDDEPKVARFATGAGPSRVPAIVGSVLAAPGRPLPGLVRTTMEGRFGHDFSRVRVHTDATAARSARAVHALAYTVGSDIAFDAGRYAPDTAAGRRLLAHELAHVVQQSGSPTDPGGPAVSEATDPAEIEAASAAGSVAEEGDRARSAAVRVRGLAPRTTAVARQDAGVQDAGVQDAGVHDAGVQDAGVTSDAGAARSDATNNQLSCVIRLGGCANSRPAGIPTPAEISSYNDMCRREAPYSGPDLTPTDAECRNPPQPSQRSASLAFAQSLDTQFPGWLDVLPNCPCTDAEARSSSDWSGPGACGSHYHPGAATGYRSARGYPSVPGTDHGQQCCYGPDGKLITAGAGAGTPDLVHAPSGFWAAVAGIVTSGPGPLAAWSHKQKDVDTWEELGWSVYNQYWIPNNGNGCESNVRP